MNYQEKKKLTAEVAAEIWAKMDANAKHGVRFGLFPAEIMREAEKKYAIDGRELSIALMDCASKDGGMRA